MPRQMKFSDAYAGDMVNFAPPGKKPNVWYKAGINVAQRGRSEERWVKSSTPIYPLPGPTLLQQLFARIKGSR